MADPNLLYCDGPYNGDVYIEQQRLLQRQLAQQSNYSSGGLVKYPSMRTPPPYIYDTGSETVSEKEIEVKPISKQEFIDKEHEDIMKEWARIQNINLNTLEVLDQEDNIEIKLKAA